MGMLELVNWNCPRSDPVPKCPPSTCIEVPAQVVPKREGRIERCQLSVTYSRLQLFPLAPSAKGRTENGKEEDIGVPCAGGNFGYRRSQAILLFWEALAFDINTVTIPLVVTSSLSW